MDMSDRLPGAFRAGYEWIGSELLKLLRLEFIPAQLRGSLAFALRTWLACMLALYLAFFLQLDQPYWACMAVLMGTQPTPGMALSKGYYRIVGTLVGSFMGLVLIAFWAQAPELFILALALWIGACTIASNLLRNFRAYGAVLAGYTAAIIALGAYAAPNQVFYIAMARGSATIIGIACATFITLVLAKHEAQEKVTAKIRRVIRTAALRGAFSFTGSFRDRVALGKPLVCDLIALDAEIEFAAAESPQFRIHADLARSLLAHLFGVIAAKRSLEDHLIRVGLTQDRETVALFAAVMKLLEAAPQRIDDDQWEDLEKSIEAFRLQLREHSPEDAGMEMSRTVSSRVVLDRLDDLLRHYGHAIHDWQVLQGGWKRKPSLHLDFHQDHRVAWINGARAALAVVVGGAFWIASAWSSGAGMLIQLGVVCSLFSAAPRPDLAGMAFLKGALLGTVVAFVCNFYLLQNIDGFPLMALIMGLFLIPGAVAFLHPKTSGSGLAFCVTFLAISRPLNPMNYDVVSFFNNAVAADGGLVCGVLVYILFMPPDPRAARRYVVYRIRRGLQIISQRNPIPPYWAWQTRMADRVNRLHDPDNPSGTSTDEWYEGGLGALNLGNEVLRLRLLLEEGRLAANVAALVRSVLKSFEKIVVDPDSNRFTIQAVSATFQRHSEPPENKEDRRAWFRTLGILQEMEAFFIDYPGFLTPH